jgi:hypothetical protein
MWFLLAAVALWLMLLVAVLYHGAVPVLLFVVAYGLYVWYIDDGPVTGYRTIDALRGLSWWGWRHLCHLKLTMPAGQTFVGPQAAQYIFVVLPNRTNAALFWTFGVYGSVPRWRAVAANMRLSYVMPAAMFWVPVLRELLLFTGAVADGPDVIRTQLSLGRNVAYAPNGMRDVLLRQPGQVYAPPLELFCDASSAASLYLVPVVVHETPGPLLASVPALWPLQQWFVNSWLRYPWPCIWLPRPASAPLVGVTIGSPLLGSDYAGRPDALERDFCSAAESIHNVSRLGDPWTWVQPCPGPSVSGPVELPLLLQHPNDTTKTK